MKQTNKKNSIYLRKSVFNAKDLLHGAKSGNVVGMRLNTVLNAVNVKLKRKLNKNY